MNRITFSPIKHKNHYVNEVNKQATIYSRGNNIFKPRLNSEKENIDTSNYQIRKTSARSLTFGAKKL